MAVLEHVSSLHGDCTDCIAYIQDRHKVVAPDRLANMMRYIMQGNVEQISSVGYNGCSVLREMAAEQFRLAKTRYDATHKPRNLPPIRISVEQYLTSNHKTTLPKHLFDTVDRDGYLTIDRQEVSAEHLVLSPHKEDQVSPKLLQAVLDDLMAHPYFKGFHAITNLHWNTDEPHAHILICNYSKDGANHQGDSIPICGLTTTSDTV